MLAVATPLFGMLVDDDPDSTRRPPPRRRRRRTAAGRPCCTMSATASGTSAGECRRAGGEHHQQHSWAARTDELTDDAPIGTPVTNTSVYLLDEQHEVVPRGRLGEIALSGDGVSPGYLGSDAEANRRFIELQADGASVRAYLTGDLARINGRGQLVFAGRKDRQLKVRGLRIERRRSNASSSPCPASPAPSRWRGPLDSPNKTRLAAFYLTRHGGVGPQQVRAAITGTLPDGFSTRLPARRRRTSAHRERQGRRVRPGRAPAGTGCRRQCGRRRPRRRSRPFGRCGAAGVPGRPRGRPFDPRCHLPDGHAPGHAIEQQIRTHHRRFRCSACARRNGSRSCSAERPPLRAPLTRGARIPVPRRGYAPHELPFVFGSFWTALRSGTRLDEAVGAGDLPAGEVRRSAAVVTRSSPGPSGARHEVLRVRFGSDLEHPQVRVLPAGETRQGC